MRYTKTIEADSTYKRDAGKVFKITEPSAFESEMLSMQLVVMLSKAASNYSFAAPFANMGVAGLFNMLRAVLNRQETDESLESIVELLISMLGNLEIYQMQSVSEKLLKHVQIIRDKNRPDIAFELLESDIEEFTTLLTLKKEVLKVIFGFFTPTAR